MANKQVEAASQPDLTFTAEQLEQMLSRVLDKAKEPYVDVKKIAAQEKQRLRMREQIKLNAKRKEALQEACTHLRGGHSGLSTTSTFFWYAPKRGGEFGVCCRCEKKVLHTDPDYARLRRIPTGTD